MPESFCRWIVVFLTSLSGIYIMSTKWTKHEFSKILYNDFYHLGWCTFWKRMSNIFFSVEKSAYYTSITDTPDWQTLLISEFSSFSNTCIFAFFLSLNNGHLWIYTHVVYVHNKQNIGNISHISIKKRGVLNCIIKKKLYMIIFLIYIFSCCKLNVCNKCIFIHK